MKSFILITLFVGLVSVSVGTSAPLSNFIDCSGGENSSVRIQFNNPTKNWIQLETCNQPYQNFRATCSHLQYFKCPQWVRPGFSGVVLIPSDSTYAVLEYCVKNPSSIHCLTNPGAMMLYGPHSPGTGPSFPTSFSVPASGASFCTPGRVGDCPSGSICDSTTQPAPTCISKLSFLKSIASIYSSSTMKGLFLDRFLH